MEQAGQRALREQLRGQVMLARERVTTIARAVAPGVLPRRLQGGWQALRVRWSQQPLRRRVGLVGGSTLALALLALAVWRWRQSRWRERFSRLFGPRD
jgi:hypothetical protein